MPNPTPASVHVNGLLTEMSVGWMQDDASFVADRVFGRVGVQKQSDIIPEYDRGDLYRIMIDRRAAGAIPTRIGYRTKKTQTYFAEEWAADHVIDDQLRANADAPFSPEVDGTRFLTQQLKLRREQQWIVSFFSTGNLWTGSSDGADLVAGTDFTAWSNAASNPLDDVAKYRSGVKRETGYYPNKLVLHDQVWNDLKNHPDIVERITGNGGPDNPAVVNRRSVAALMELEDVQVASAVQNSGGEGSTAADSFGFIAGKHALLVYADPNPTLWSPTGGVTYTWDALVSGAAAGQAILTFREPNEIGDIVRIRAAWDQKIVASDVGVFLANASTK